MPSSHRAEGPARGTRGWLIAAGVVLVVVIAVVVALIVGGSDKTAQRAPAMTPPPTHTPTATPTATATAAPTEKPSSPPTNQPQSPSIAGVPPSPPHDILIGQLVQAGFGDSIDVVDNHLIPERADRLQRLGTRGLPGSPGTDTVVLTGAANDRGTGVLDRLDEATRGDRVELTTRTGILTYRVTTIAHAAPNSVLGLPQVRARVAGRLVIDVANYAGADRTDTDLVVVAQLVKAQPMRP